MAKPSEMIEMIELKVSKVEGYYTPLKIYWSKNEYQILIIDQKRTENKALFKLRESSDDNLIYSAQISSSNFPDCPAPSFQKRNNRWTFLGSKSFQIDFENFDSVADWIQNNPRAIQFKLCDQETRKFFDKYKETVLWFFPRTKEFIFMIQNEDYSLFKLKKVPFHDMYLLDQFETPRFKTPYIHRRGEAWYLSDLTLNLKIEIEFPFNQLNGTFNQS